MFAFSLKVMVNHINIADSIHLTRLSFHTRGPSGVLNLKPNTAKLLRIKEALRESTCGTLTCCTEEIETKYSGKGTDGKPGVIAFQFHADTSLARRFGKSKMREVSPK
jgi:hypothetical protein